MRLRQLFEQLNRTGEGKSCVVGWGRGMGHKGHMYLASSVITQSKETGADPYFVLSRSVGKDDPLYPEEKLNIYKKVFPHHGQIFHVATEEMPDLTRVLSKLNHHGYTDCTVVVGADQVKALSYVKQYNGVPDKAGNIPFNFASLNVISRQETNDPSREEEGPRATPMRDILRDPNATDEQRFQAWRNAMSPELSDDEVMDLMHKAQQRMSDPAFGKAPKKPKKEKVADEAFSQVAADKNKLRYQKQGSIGHGIGWKSMTDKPSELSQIIFHHFNKFHNMMKYLELKNEHSKHLFVERFFKKYGYPMEVFNDVISHIQNHINDRNNGFTESVKYANKVVREMRAREFTRQQISELSIKPDMPLHKDLDQHGQGVYLARDVGGYDRVYHMNRLWMAMAMADGKSKGKIPGAYASSWSEKYNTIHPFSDADDLKIQSALKTVPSDHGHISSRDHKSREHDDVNKTSPVAKPKKNRYGI